MITHSVRIAGRRYVALLAAVGLIASCRSVVAPERVVQILEIAPQKVPCVGMVQQECLQIRGSGETDWQYFYGEIIGFTFEPGHAYVIRVERLTVKNPPADGSSYEYRLLEVISKTPPGSSWAASYSDTKHRPRRASCSAAARINSTLEARAIASLSA